MTPSPLPPFVPVAGDRRRHAAPAHLTFFHGPMDCGKSTLALQVDHNQSRQGRHGLRLTQGDRSAAPQISSRVGLSREAVELDPDVDVRLLVRGRWADGHRVDYVIVDEAQFLTGRQVEQLAELVDESHVDVYAFGLTTDFRAQLFTGTRRLFELADDVQRIQVEVLCWCGLPGLLNARVVDGAMVREGETVVVADTVAAPTAGDDVRYQVLCRRHHVRGQLGPTPTGPGQLTLSGERVADHEVSVR
ncbi:thymidine kinase [Modestobacter sp. Leaf380]|uniref:thymidine kinase n=1 Tax=Modestobacter sp. Leaf380 TaxID=1736356 RepID=UPI0006FE4283|nr:thymidine kinase [Modestobacter sp. Leaf380]KQS65769.1 thymidine kinase [Modestobacter sp. Leaf380]